MFVFVKVRCQVARAQLHAAQCIACNNIFRCAIAMFAAGLLQDMSEGCTKIITPTPYARPPTDK